MVLKNSVLEIIEKIAERYPERIAVQSSGDTITYRQLWQQSDKIAANLQSKLQDDKRPVMVYGHKNPHMITCFLGCVKSGRAYCPVDISMPQNRIEDIADKIGNSIILATEPFSLSGFDVIDVQNILSCKKK